MCRADAYKGNFNIPADSAYELRADFRLGHKFFSIFVNEQGSAYVIKGYGTTDSTILEINKSDTSKIFKLDSVKALFSLLDKLKNEPQVIKYSTSSVPRAEVYYNLKKVYDSNVWDMTFWDLFRPIMEQVPDKFNPFLASEHPFD